MEVRFVVLAPQSKNRVVQVRLPILVGRGDEAKFRFQKDSVSRRHCEFLVEGGVVHVRDLGSTNGTLLDKEQIPTGVATAVRSGAVVNVGGVNFRVEYDTAAVKSVDQPDDNDTLPLALDPGGEAAADSAGAIDVAAADEPEGPATVAGQPLADEPADGFAFLPEAEEATPPGDDEKLDDFFKSLS